MWMWRGDLPSAADDSQSTQTTSREGNGQQGARAAAPLSCTTVPSQIWMHPPRVVSYTHAATPSTTTVPPAPVVSSNRPSKKGLGAPYQSIDPITVRVWGMPNSGGRGQCFDCPNRAMPNNHRCQSCLRALAEAVHEQMTSEDLRELQSSFDAALAKLSGSRHKDTAERLQKLYAQLQAGQVSPAIQSQLLIIAKATSTNDRAGASRAVATLSTQHWEEHKEWLMGMKRLLPAP